MKLREWKESYRRKLENNARDLWTGMKEITGFKVRDRQPVGSLERANEQNCFFNRFSSQSSAVSSTTHPDPQTHTVHNAFTLPPSIPPDELLGPIPPAFEVPFLH